MANNEEFIQNFAKQYGIKNAKLKFQPGSQKGDNFMGLISRVQISGEMNGETRILNFVVKSAPTNLKLRDAIPTKDIFLREIYAYSEVVPIMKVLQAELPEEEKYKFVKCYAVDTEDMREKLVLEDLMLQSYCMHKPRLDTLDFDHLSLALKALAKFHALSYALTEKDPAKFKELSQQARDFVYTDKSTIKKYFTIAAEKAIKVIDDDGMREKTQLFANDLHAVICKLLEPNKYSVLCHGDFWKNNLLFSYKNGKPVSACPLDYQFLRYSSPLTDIVYLIFCCSSQKERKQNFWKLLDSFHDELSKQLERLSLDVENVFPKAEFMKEVKRVGSFGLASAIPALVFMTCAIEDIPDPADVVNGEVKDAHESSETFKLYKERITGVVEDTIEFGFLE